jgi:hypothetical protein
MAAKTLDSTRRKSSAVRNADRSISRDALPGSMEVSGGGNRLRGEGAQQMRLAVEQIRQRLRAQRPGDKIGHARLGIGDAARPAPRVA